MDDPTLCGTTGIGLGRPDPIMAFGEPQRKRIYESRKWALFVLFAGAIVTMVGLPYWHRPDSKVTTIALKSKKHPPTLTLPHVGWPGTKNVKCDVSGQHSSNMAPAMADDFNSETANPVVVDTVPTAGWLPNAVETIRPVYSWSDWVTVPHVAMKWPFLLDPTYNTAKCGLGPSAALWDYFEEATYCKGSETLYLDPTPKRACLGDAVAVLSCVSGEGWCSLPLGTEVTINGIPANASSVFLSPFDSDIRAGQITPFCDNLYDNYYLGTSSLSLAFSDTKKSIARTGAGVVPETVYGSQHVDLVIRCNLSEADVPNGTLVVGVLPMDVSFVYNAKSHTLSLYDSHKVTLSNDWRSVLIINLCLLCLAHWLSDVEKNADEPWTVVPELIGLVSAASGVYLQKLTNSVYHRCLDVANGPLAAEMVTWVVLLELAANVACLVVLRSQPPNGKKINDEFGKRVATVRKLSYECALLGSVFLQVVSASDSMFDAYMGFFVGAAFLYSTTYRALQTFIEAPDAGQHRNHLAIRILAVGAFGVALYAFYVLAALPSVDPVAGLARHAVEGSSLCASAVVVFGIVGLAERF